MHDFYTFCPKLKPPTPIAQEARVQKKQQLQKYAKTSQESICHLAVFFWNAWFPNPTTVNKTQKTLRIDSKHLWNSNEFIQIDQTKQHKPSINTTFFRIVSQIKDANNNNNIRNTSTNKKKNYKNTPKPRRNKFVIWMLYFEMPYFQTLPESTKHK